MRIIIISILMTDDDRANDHRPPASKGAARVPAGVREPRQISSRDLLGGGKELVIVHDGRRYYLRVTQNGKLILTA